jgi:GntR family transcriptional regulator, carbon starvation induced regulator
MASGPDKNTLGEVVYAAVRTSILAGQLRPGQRLKVSDLSADHGVSLNIVREALNRLTGEQLVRAEPKIGFAVTDLSLEDLADLSAVRVAIESTALRWAIERGDMAWESQVVAAHYRLANTSETEGQPPALSNEWIQTHSEFHIQILSACGSPRMREITRSLSDAAQIYRRWSLSLPNPDRDVAAEHADLVDAVLTRDADRAVAALTAHIGRTRDTVLAHVTTNDSATPQQDIDALAAPS